MNKLKVGFVGAGWMGGVQLQRLKDRYDVKIMALFEPNRARGEETLSSLGLSPDLLVANYDAIIDDPDIDAVWVVSPNSFHGPQAIKAMKVNKHVFCEKPCATKFRDFAEQIELEKAHPNLITFVDYIMNFDTMESSLRDMIATGEFGQVTQIQVNYRHPVNIAGDKVWKLNKDIMGDAICMGINHAISVMINLMAPQASPIGVYATNMDAKVRAFETPPIWNILVKFDNKATGFCFGNIDNSNGYDAYHNIFGTKGGFVFDSQLDRAHKVRYWSSKSTQGQWIYPLDVQACRSQGMESLAWPPETTTPDSGDVVEHQTAECVGHFIECVKSQKQSPLSFANSATIGEIAWAAQISAATGQEVPLPLDQAQAKTFFGE